MGIYSYRKELLKSGFIEGTKKKQHFYKEIMPYTALAINITNTKEGIVIVYGYGSTAFTKFTRCENILIEEGFPANEDINLRKKTIIRNRKEEESAKRAITSFFQQFSNMNKDMLLKAAKEHRKAFVNKFVEKLKPLGLKKKGNFWFYEMPNNITFKLGLDKSQFSDEYRIDMYFSNNNNFVCWRDMLSIHSNEAFFDWQLEEEKDIENFIEQVLVKRIKEILSVPLEEFGKNTRVGKECFCDRQRCPKCWIAKNWFELRKDDYLIEIPKMLEGNNAKLISFEYSGREEVKVEIAYQNQNYLFVLDDGKIYFNNNKVCDDYYLVISPQKDKLTKFMEIIKQQLKFK